MPSARCSLVVRLVTIAITCWSGSLALAQRPAISLPRLPDSTAQGMEGGFWRTDGNFQPILHLTNRLVTRSVAVTPELFFADGSRYQLPAVTLQPSGVASINISSAIQSAPLPLQPHISNFGTAGFHYQNSAAGSVIGSIHSVDETASLSYESSLHADSEKNRRANRGGYRSETIDGLWWKPTLGADQFIVLSNTMPNAGVATLTVTDSNGSQLSVKPLILAPHASTMLKISALLGANLPLSSSGGLSIQYNGPRYGMTAMSGVEDFERGFSQTISMYEAHPEDQPDAQVHSVSIAAPGIMVGTQSPQMLFPQGTSFKPYMVMHNTTGSPRQVSIGVTFDRNGTPDSTSLGSVELGALSTRVLPITEFLLEKGLANVAESINFSSQYLGHEGDVQFEQGSVDQSGSYVFQVASVLQRETASRTICYWSVQGDNDTMISLWNYKSAPQSIKVILYFPGGTYKIPISLAAQQSYELSISSLLRGRIPDESGAVLPANVVEGSAMLMGAVDERSRIDIASSTAVFNTRNGTCTNTCMTCNGVTSFSLQPFSPGSFIIPNTTTQASAIEKWSTGGVYTYTSGPSWTSNKTSVATINSAAVANGVAAGQATITASDYEPVDAGYICFGGYGSCPDTTFNSSGPLYIIIPTLAVVTGNVVNQAYPAGVCPSTQAGWERQVNRQVLDQFNNNVVLTGQRIGEIYATNSDGLGLGAIQTAVPWNAPSGMFQDLYAMCSTKCKPTTSASSDYTQSYNDSINGNYPFILQPIDVKYTCTGVLLNGSAQ